MELTMKILIIILLAVPAPGLSQTISKEEIKQSQQEIAHSLKQAHSGYFYSKDSASERLDAYNQQKNRERMRSNVVQPVNIQIPLIWYVETFN